MRIFCVLDVNIDSEAKIMFNNAVSMMLLKVDPKFVIYKFLTKLNKFCRRDWELLGWLKKALFC